MQKPTPFVLKNVVIIDGTGAAPIGSGSVVVEGDRIKEVLPGAPGRIPAQAAVLDGRGQTLLPGLIDAHVHVASSEANPMEQQRRNYPSIQVINTVKVLEETLMQGFTSVRDCGGADPGFRVAQEQGLIRGPRLSVSGRFISQTGGHGDFRLPTEIYDPRELPAGMAGGVYDGVDAVRKAAREQLRSGVDFVKVMAGGGCMSPADEIDTSQYSLDELRAVVWEAEAAGKYVAAHCYSDRSIINSVKSGIRTIEHGNLLTQAGALAIKEAQAYLVPTIVTYEVMPEMGHKLGVPANNLRKMIQARDHGLEALSIAYRSGCKIGSGSDCLGPMHVFKGRELEIQAKVMGPMNAIVAATKTNAEIIGQADDLGTIEAGKLADLILVDGDPLKDIGLIQNFHEKITVIVQGGCFYKNLLA
ncbi:MAG: amidohydrolase family protein [Desulfobacterales bacterium]|nr:MAG: amidohydrolase family protein [Desulfobacterales bacterium]